MTAITKEGNSYSKKHLENARIAHIASRTIMFYHKASSGTGTINLNSLTMPTELTGVSQISPEEVTSARLFLHRKNLQLISSVHGILHEGQDFSIADSLTIMLLASKYPAGTAANEIFYGRIFCSPLSDLIVASAKPIVKTYTGLTGTTLNLGLEYRVNENNLQNVGQIKVFKNGSLVFRNTNNSSSVLDGGYYEVNAGNGYGTTIVMNSAVVTSDKFVVDFGIRAITDNNAIGEIERLNTAILKIAQDLSVGTGQPLESYLLANPSETERRAFGDLVLSLKERVTTLEGTSGGSEVVNSTAGNETDKAPSVSAIKTYADNKVINSTSGSETDKAPSVASIKNHVSSAVSSLVVNSTNGNETTQAPSVSAMKSYVQNAPAKASVNITASDIDWSAGQVFYKDISANTTLTFSNVSDGTIITAVFRNTSAASVSVVLPAGIYRDPAIDLVVEAGKENMYTFIRSNAKTYVSFVTKMVNT